MFTQNKKEVHFIMITSSKRHNNAVVEKKINPQPALQCKNFEKNIAEARRTREIRKRGKKAVEQYEKNIDEICEKLRKW